MKVKLSWVFLACIIFAAISTVAPLFEEGYHVNIDSPPHLARLWCLSEQGIAPSNWCPSVNAGQPTTQYYYPVLDQLLVFLGYILGLNLAYKLFLVLAWAIQGISAYFLLKSEGYSSAPYIALGLLLFNRGSWHFAGFDEVFMVAMWPYILSTGFLFIAIALYLRYLRDPSNKNMVLATGSTALFTHPLTILVGIFFYAAITIVHYKEVLDNKKQSLILVGLTAAVNAYYLLPLVTRLDYFPNALRGGFSWDMFMSYIGTYIHWYWIVLGILGIIYLVHRPNKGVATILITTLMITFLNLFDSPLKNYLAGIRFGAFLAPFVFILTALGVEYISKFAPKQFRVLCAYGLGSLLVLLAVSSLWATNFTILLSSQPIFSQQMNMYDSLEYLPPGRILIEETLYNIGTNQGPLPQAFTHSHNLIPVLTGREIVGFNTYFFPKEPNFMNTDKGKLWGKPIEQWNWSELHIMMEKYNIKYVLTHSPNWVNYFSPHAKVIVQNPPFYVLELNVSGSYYATNATIVGEEYKPWGGLIEMESDTPSTIIQKTNIYPLWHAEIDGKPAKVEDCDMLTCVRVPEGRHKVKFSIRRTLADHIGSLITLLAVLLMICLWRR